MDGQLVAVLDRAADVVDVGQVDHRVDALAEQVERQRHQVDVAGPLAVAEQAALDPVGAGQQAELGRGHAGPPVVVRVQAQHERVAPGEVAVHPLDGVGVHVGRGHLDRGRQVEDERVVRARLDDLGHLVAHPQRELQLGAGVGLRAVLEADLGVAHVLGVLLAQPGRGGGDVGDAVHVQAEHDPPLQRGRRVVEVDDRLLGPDQGLVGAGDEVLARLGEHLDGDVVGDAVGLDQGADEVEVRLARRGEADLDLLVAEPDEQVEHPHLALDVHRVDERLVAVAQVDRAPARGGLDALVGPGPVRQLDAELLVERDVAREGHAGRLLGVDRGGHLLFLACGVGLGAGRVEPPRRGGRPVSGPRRGEQAGGWSSARGHRTRVRPLGRSSPLSDGGAGIAP